MTPGHAKVGAYIIPFFFNDTAPTEIYTLSLHDALPISCSTRDRRRGCRLRRRRSGRHRCWGSTTQRCTTGCWESPGASWRRSLRRGGYEERRHASCNRAATAGGGADPRPDDGGGGTFGDAAAGRHGRGGDQGRVGAIG